MTLKYWHKIPYSDDGYVETVKELEIHDNFWFKIMCILFFIMWIILGLSLFVIL